MRFKEGAFGDVFGRVILNNEMAKREASFDFDRYLGLRFMSDHWIFQ